MSFLYVLEKYKGPASRYTCPQCNKPKTFVRYVNTQTQQHLHASVGRCNREQSCGYHFKPQQYFAANPQGKQPLQTIPPNQPTPLPYTMITHANLVDSMQAYARNNFAQFLIKRFGWQLTRLLLLRYLVGTSKQWPGANVFWQVDNSMEIRTGKVMLYNSQTGKRVKQPHNHITWVHSLLKQSDFTLNQCLFGEHLLADTTKPVALVESEKTAIVASVYHPQYIWLATGGLSNLTAQKCKVLKGRFVILYPDLGAYDKWLDKMQTLQHLAMFTISDLLEMNADPTHKASGYDIADYLLQFDHTNFTPYEPREDESA